MVKAQLQLEDLLIFSFMQINQEHGLIKIH